jgi:hypothetical protein
MEPYISTTLSGMISWRMASPALSILTFLAYMGWVLLGAPSSQAQIFGKSALMRERGAVYLDDVTQKPILLKIKDSAIAYSTVQGQTPLGTFLAGTSVTLLAFSDKAGRVRGRAAHGDIVGWVGLGFLDGAEAAFFDRLKQAAARQTEVQAMIEQKQIAIGMTPNEVQQSLGKPTERRTRIDGAGSAEAWLYITYERVPQRVAQRNILGQVIYSTVYVKMETGRVEIAFAQGTVSHIESAEGRPETTSRSRMIVPPIILR